ncbi:MAG TPA: hypothetical protein PKO07_15890, partial [Pseudomonadota bacterium]|nr:hypothetical protein [Pseudomonadota bacterium]
CRDARAQQAVGTIAASTHSTSLGMLFPTLVLDEGMQARPRSSDRQVVRAGSARCAHRRKPCSIAPLPGQARRPHRRNCVLP